MANTVKTQQTSKSTSDILVNYVIDQTETTRKIMRARVVDNPKDADACISCVILHQRKGRNEQWEDCEAINLQTLKAGEGVKLHLGCSETKALLSSLEQAYSVGRQGVQRGISRFVVANSDDMVIPAGAEARYIKLLIEQSGKSYQELERITGIKKSSLQRYASGVTAKIPLTVIEQLSKAFNVSQEYLMGWSEDDKKVSPSVADLSEGEKMWLELYHRLSPETRELMIHTMGGFDRLSKDKQKLALQMIRIALGDQE